MDSLTRSLLPCVTKRQGRRLPAGGVFLTSLMLFVLLSGCTQPGGSASDLNGHLLVAGSTALQPLATAAASLFQQQHAHVHVEVKGGGSLLGLQSLTNHHVNIGVSDVYADPAVYPDPNLTDHIVAVIPFTMIVGPDVAVKTLTQQEIIDIFSTGTIRAKNPCFLFRASKRYWPYIVQQRTRNGSLFAGIHRFYARLLARNVRPHSTAHRYQPGDAYQCHLVQARLGL